MAKIPAAISNILLASLKLTIIDFIQYPTPPNKLGRHLSATPNLFSEAPSAITDKRNATALWTVSGFTWLTPPLHSKLSVASMS